SYPDDRCERDRDGGELDAGSDGGAEHVAGDVRVALREPGDVYRDGDGRGGNAADDQHAAVGDGAEWGGVQSAPGPATPGRERQCGEPGRDDGDRGDRYGPDRSHADERRRHDDGERGGDVQRAGDHRVGGELHAALRERHAHRADVGDDHTERGDGGDDRGEQSHEPAGNGGGRRELAAVGDREGCERKPGGAGGGDVRGG